ncbi:MAG: hypothetical protein IID41_17335, partial [Planctomycetes bacterium]|nr:hypothetical protein [Planctomycetota bacterium]
MILNAGEVDIALQSWRVALVNQPDLTQAHLRQLELALEVARLNGLLNDWNRLHEMAETFLQSNAPRNATQTAFAHNANGLALLALGVNDEVNFQKGEEELRTAVELDPDALEYAVDLATQYFLRDQVEEGERRFKELIRDHASAGPAAAKVSVRYARHLASRTRFDEADAMFKKGLSLAQGEAKALLDAKLAYAVFLSQQWARAYSEDNEDPSAVALFDHAESILKECVSADPEAYDAYLQLAILKASAKQHAQAVEICEERLQRGLVRKGIEATRNRSSAFTLMIYASDACIAEANTAQEAEDDAGRQAWLEKAALYVAGARGEF